MKVEKLYKKLNQGIPYGLMSISTIVFLILIFIPRKDSGWGLWGFFFYDEFPWFVRLIFGLSPILLTILLNRVFQKKFYIPTNLIKYFKSCKYITPILLFIVSFFIFWFFRERRYWGDAEATIKILEGVHPDKPIGRLFWKEPGDRFCAVIFYGIFHRLFGWGAGGSIALMSCLAGSVFVIVLLGLAKELGTNWHERFFIFAFTLSMGANQLFFGHVENYTLVTLFILIFIFSGVRYLKGKGCLYIVVFYSALAVSIHGLAVFLFLPLIILFLFLRKRKILEHIYFIILSTIPGILYLIALYIVFRLLGAPPLVIGFNRFVDDDSVFFNFSNILRWQHLWGVSQTYLLALPFGVFIILKNILGYRKSLLKRLDPILIFLIIASLSFFIFSLFFQTKIGRLRDWDLFAPAALPVAITGSYLYIKTIGFSRVYNRILGLYIVLFSLFFTLPWILSNYLNKPYPSMYFSKPYPKIAKPQPIYPKYMACRNLKILGKV